MGILRIVERHPVLDTIGGPLLAAVFLLLFWAETRWELRRRVRPRWERLVRNGAVYALAYEVAMEAATEFHHSNWRLPLRLERILNLVIVTPRMHGIHHSVVERETNSNWSTVFSWWDRLHRTMRVHVPQDQVV